MLRCRTDDCCLCVFVDRAAKARCRDVRLVPICHMRLEGMPIARHARCGAPRPVRQPSIEPHAGDALRGLLQSGHVALARLHADPRQRPVHADGREHIAVRVEDRHGDADNALDTFLVVQGVARGTDALELGLEVWRGSSRCSLWRPSACGSSRGCGSARGRGRQAAACRPRRYAQRCACRPPDAGAAATCTR